MSPHIKTLLMIFIALVLIGALLVVWSISKKEKEESLDARSDTFPTAGESSEIEAPSANPYQDVPNLNPVEGANPFRELKTNPFAQ